MGRKVGGRFYREGTYVYLWLTHVDVQQKPSKYYKVIILQSKKKKRTLWVGEFKTLLQSFALNKPFNPIAVVRPLGSSSFYFFTSIDQIETSVPLAYNLMVDLSTLHIPLQYIHHQISILLHKSIYLVGLGRLSTCLQDRVRRLLMATERNAFSPF